jgi:hypothetical protein
LAFDLRLDVFDSQLSATQALSLCRHQSSGEENPKGCCAAKDSEDSEEVYRALKGEVAARTRRARGGHLHIDEGAENSRNLNMLATEKERICGDQRLVNGDQ